MNTYLLAAIFAMGGAAAKAADVNYCDPSWPAHPQARSATTSTFSTVVSTAVPGDVILLEDGTYRCSGVTKIANSGTPEKPIVLRARNPWQVTIEGHIKVLGRHWVIAGLRFHNKHLTVGDKGEQTAGYGTGVRITRNYFTSSVDGSNHAMLYVACSRNTRTDHNDFGDENNNFRRSGMLIQNGLNGNSRIDHNYFHGSPYIPDSPRDEERTHEYEALWLAPNIHGGTNDDLHTGMLVERNVFENWWGDDEVIAAKTSGLTIRNNRSVNSHQFCLRAGNGNLFKNNVMENSRGVRVWGYGHQIVGNAVVNSGKWTQGAVRLSAGNWNRTMAPSVWYKGCEACHETVVCGNTGNGAVVLGYGHVKKGGVSLPITDTKWCADNTLTRVIVAETGLDTQYRHTGDVGEAWAPTREDVGPLATNDVGPLTRPPAPTNVPNRAAPDPAAGALAPPVAPGELSRDR